MFRCWRAKARLKLSLLRARRIWPAMAPKAKAKAKGKSMKDMVQPTEQELQKAREMLTACDSKGKASNMACFKAWCKRLGIEDHMSSNTSI